MKSEGPSAESETERRDSLYGDAKHATGQTWDEQQLYGEPCHEVESNDHEQTLYGEPQHETRENPELPDIELLFARMQVESFARPTVLTARETSAVQTTEQ